MVSDAERTAAEGAMQASDSQYRMFVDHATDALMIHRDGVVIDVNRQACESLGYTREELIETLLKKVRAVLDDG